MEKQSVAISRSTKHDHTSLEIHGKEKCNLDSGGLGKGRSILQEPIGVQGTIDTASNVGHCVSVTNKINTISCQVYDFPL